MHDLGTVRIFEIDGMIDVHFPRADNVTKGVVKELKGRWDPNRKCWRLDPAYSRTEVPAMIDRISKAVLEATPEGWRKALPILQQISATTKQFEISIGAGGVRLELPRNHRLEYALKDDIEGVDRDGRSWLVPASVCDRPATKLVLRDATLEDKKALGEMLDYLESYQMSGELSLTTGEIEEIGLRPGAAVFADPSFVRTADKTIMRDLVRLYPLRVQSVGKPGETVAVTVRFIVGDEAYMLLRSRLSHSAKQTGILDSRHIAGRWVRRRA